MSANSTTLAPWTLLQCLKKNEKSLSLAQMFLFAILFLNGPIIFVLVRKRRRLSTGNTIILHLSVADFLLSLVSFCNHFVLLAGSPLRVSAFFCQLTAFLGRLTYNSSIYFITIMAACRCYSVVKPFQYHDNVRPSRINKICFGVWCSCLVYAVLPLIGCGEYEVAYGKCICWLDTHKYPYNWLVYCIISHVIPLVTNSVFISITASKIRRGTTKMKAKIVRMRHNARNKVDFKCKKAKLEPKNLSEGCNHDIAWKKEVEDRVFKKTALQAAADTSVEVKAAIHQAYFSESQDSPPITKRPAPGKNIVKVEITKCEMKSKAQRNDSGNKSIEEHEDNSVIKEVGRVNRGMIESHTKQESQAYLHTSWAVLGTCNEKQTNLESVVQYKKRKPKNSEAKLEITKKSVQQGSKPHLESNSLHQPHTIRRPHRDRNQVHLESIAHLERIEQNKRNQREQDENQLNVVKNHQGSQQHLESIKSRNTVTRSQYKQASKDFPILIIALVFASFVLFCSPMFLVRSLYALAPDSVPQNAFVVANILTGLNSLANPLLYGLLSKEIRSDIKKLFCSRILS